MRNQKRRKPKVRKPSKNEMYIRIKDGIISVDGNEIGAIERNLKNGDEPAFLCTIGDSDRWFKEGTSSKVVVDHITEIVNNSGGGLQND